MPERERDTVEFTIEGLSRDEGDITLGSFQYQLRNFSEALNQTDRIVSGEPKPTVRFRIVGLSHTSPATVKVAAIPKRPDVDHSGEILDRFVGALDQIARTGTAPEWVDRELLEYLRNLNKPVGRSVRAARLARNGLVVALNRELEAKIDVILAPEETFDGSIKGRLEAINLHLGTNAFRIYPIIGPPRVTCHFPESLREEAVGAVDRNVIAYGELKYRANAPFPSELDVREIELLPPDGELPMLTELRGAVRGTTGGLSTLEFIQQVQDEWD